VARGENTWRVRWDIPSIDGKRRCQTETVKGSRREAERVLRERLAALDKGEFIPKSSETVGSYLQSWLDGYGRTNITPRTLWGYQGYITRYITPTIGNIPLQKLQPGQIQKVYADMLERGLSHTTVIQLGWILHRAFAIAVKEGKLLRNPVDATTLPKKQHVELKMWDSHTLEKFMEVARDSRFYDVFGLDLVTGLRRSELCGLKWENVDLLAGRLSVVSTIQRITGLGLVEGKPKTDRSRRSIPLSDTAIQMLHDVRGRQNLLGAEFGNEWNPKGYVFCQVTGEPPAPDMITKEFTAIVRKAGLPHLTLHGLRHMVATLLLKSGENPKIVQELLGHSNIAITMDTYSHVLPGMLDKAVRTLDSLVNGCNIGCKLDRITPDKTIRNVNFRYGDPHRPTLFQIRYNEIRQL
jgi:integrase